MFRILVADDEEKIRELVQKYATFEGHQVSEAVNGMQAATMCREGGFDIVILDVMMPELDGFSAAREIRKHSAVPIIMLSARGEEYDRINGFECGVDDYVVKPFSPKELMLRIEAVMKRARPPLHEEDPAHDIYEKDGLCIDFTARLLYVDGKRVDCSPKEYDLLFYMARNRNIALGREQILTEVWGFDFYGGDRTLDTHIKMLRKSLGPYSSRIVTLRGTGYRFEG